MTDTPSNETGIELTTSFDRAQGRFVVGLRVGQDETQLLDKPKALLWAEEVVAAMARAEHDAAVEAQMRERGLSRESRVHLIQQLRSDRGELVHALANLVLLPGVSAFTGEPYLTLLYRGQSLGQWGTEEARRHAIGVLEVAAGADLDTAYLRALQGMSIPKTTALAVIQDLFRHRKDEA